MAPQPLLCQSESVDHALVVTVESDVVRRRMLKAGPCWRVLWQRMLTSPNVDVAGVKVIFGALLAIAGRWLWESAL